MNVYYCECSICGRTAMSGRTVILCDDCRQKEAAIDDLADMHEETCYEDKGEAAYGRED